MVANPKALQLVGVVVKESKHEIGVGTYSKVDCCGTSFAAKHILPSARLREGPQRQNFVKECQLFTDLRHPNIMQFIGIYHSNHSLLPTMALEHINESLTTFLK